MYVTYSEKYSIMASTDVLTKHLKIALKKKKKRKEKLLS